MPHFSAIQLTMCVYIILGTYYEYFLMDPLSGLR